MTEKLFTVSVVAAALGIDERTARKLLNDAGGRFDELASDPGEPVARIVLINLAAVRASDRVGRLIADLLTG